VIAVLMRDQAWRHGSAI